MGTKVKLALLSMAVASGVGLYGCNAGSEVIARPDGGSSSSGGSTGDGSGGNPVSSGGSSASGGSLGSSGSGGTSASGSGGQAAGSGGVSGPGSGGSQLGSGGASELGTGGIVASGAGTTGSGGATSSGGATGSGGATASGGAPGSGGAVGTGGTTAGSGGSSGPINVLVWNNALAYGHQARAGAIQYLKARETTDNIKFDTTYAHTMNITEGPSDTTFDASVFTDAGLDKYDVVMFLDTTGTTIDDSMKTVRRQALQDFIEKKGRGFVGTHSATDTYQGSTWPWYVDFIGANFKDHSNAGTSGTAQYYQMMTHPILMNASTPNPWNRNEEWYTFTRDPLSSKIPGIQILLTCHDTAMTQERPSAWVHEMPVSTGAARGGRLFYTAFGHSTSAFQEKAVMDMIIAGIKWSAYRL